MSTYGSQNIIAKSSKRTGRMIGVLVVLHLAVALIVPFVLIDRVRRAGFLTNGAANADVLRIAVMLLFVGSALAIGIAIAAWPVFGRHSSAMGVWLIALGIIGFTLQAVDNAKLMALLSLSQEYANAGAAKVELFQGLSILASATRKWAHYSYLLVAVSWIFLFFTILYRFSFVPRALAGFGMFASLLQIVGVSLRSFWGYPPAMLMAFPLAPAYAGLALWLMVRGFEDRQASTESEENRLKVTLRHATL
jgi:hypothetical protein